MSVHGYPVDKSIFYCDLKLEVLKLQEETADIDQDDVSLAGLLQYTVGRSLLLFHPCVRGPLSSDNTRFSVSDTVFQSVSVAWTQFLRQFK